MASGIYQILNTLTGKLYIGSAVNFTQRWKEHRKGLKRGDHHSRYLQAAWNKYGCEAFIFRPLLICAATDLLFYEQRTLDALNPSYNLAKVAGNTLGTKRTAESRAKIAAKAIGRKCPPRSAEHRAALSAALSGKPKSPEHNAALQAGRAQRSCTQEESERRSASLKRAYETGLRSRVKTQEHRNKISKFYSKLSADEVREMRRLNSDGLTGRQLAARFRTPASTVSQILRGLRYRWVA